MPTAYADAMAATINGPNHKRTPRVFIARSNGILFGLTTCFLSSIKNVAVLRRVDRFAVALKRGDLGQLAPRKKLLKSFSSFPEDFLRPSEHFGTEGFSFLPSALPQIEFHPDVPAM